jgi:lysyl-tRNA synthetase class 1
MSSSKGVVFTLPQWLEIAEPELLRYFIFRSKPMKAKEFDPGLPLLDLYDEYDLAEGVYFGKISVRGRRGAQLKRIYELSQVKKPPPEQPQRISFRFAAVLSQVMRNAEHAINILSARRMLVEPNERDIKLSLRRLNCARNWVSKHGPERLRFKIAETLPAEVKQTLTDAQREGLKQLADDLSARDYKPVELHNHIYELARKIGLDPPELFKAIYLVLTGRDFGPRAGNFISALDKNFVVKRFKEAAL